MADILAFPDNCVIARFKARHKRFTIEADLDGNTIWAHTNNTGAMTGLLRPGARALLSLAANPKRKLPYTLELIQSHEGWVGVNTSTPNRMLRLAWEKGLIPEMRGHRDFTSEARSGQSRLDARLDNPGDGSGSLWIEAKNVTLSEYRVAAFPDAVTTRGQKHLRELTAMARQGTRVAVFFLIQRPDADCFAPADYVDPHWAELFYEALDSGVMAWPHLAEISEKGIGLGRRLKILSP